MTIVPKKKSCFIITPIGADNSEVRRHADGVIEEVIRPLLQGDYGKIEASHNSNRSGSITNEIINNIYEADLVIANLTYLNPNVMYEVALRHAVAKPIIHIVCGDITKELPFDIKDYRTIFYKDDIMGTRELKGRLSDMIVQIDTEKAAKDNPIYNALKNKDIENLIKKESIEDNPTALTNMMLKQLLNRIDKIEKNIVINEDVAKYSGISKLKIIRDNIHKEGDDIINTIRKILPGELIDIGAVDENSFTLVMRNISASKDIGERLETISNMFDVECVLTDEHKRRIRVFPTIGKENIG